MQTIDLSGPGAQKLLAERIANDLNDYTAKLYDDGHRNHLGASMIGDECARKLWYNFRWVLTQSFIDTKGVDQKGRMMRLFNRGHKEEFRFVEWLRGMGFIVEEFEPTSRLFYRVEDNKYCVAEAAPEGGNNELYVEVTGDVAHQERAAAFGVKRKQLRISGVNGHYGGSLDAIITFPAIYGSFRMLGEFKTSGQKYFEKLKEETVIRAKPEHYAQMCSYGERYKLDYALYLCVNKDTDEIYPEIVKLDPQHALRMTERAHSIINSPVPLKRLSENSAYYKCKFCSFAPVCHGQAPYDKNCRSCTYAQPVENGEWFCHRFANIIPKDFIKKGCDAHTEAR